MPQVWKTEPLCEDERDSSSSDEEYLYSTSKDMSKVPTVNVRVNDVDIEMIVDTGASMDILDESAFQTINRNKEIALQPTTKRLFAYGSTDQLATIGQFGGTISFQDKRHETPIHVLKGNHGSLLSYKTAMALGILNLQVRHVQDDTTPHDKLCTKYPTLFQGIGQLKGVEVKLHIDEMVTPIAHAAAKTNSLSHSPEGRRRTAQPRRKGHHRPC